jgi:hypothetical protein
MRSSEHEPTGEQPDVDIAELDVPPGSDGRRAQQRVVEELLGQPPSMPIEEEIEVLRKVFASEDIAGLGRHLAALESRLQTEVANRQSASEFVNRLNHMADAGRQILLDLREHKLRALVGVGTTMGIGVAVLVALKRSDKQKSR